MQCSADGTTLVVTERQSVEIDYCPSCRGAWLDRGELDKIIERSLQATSAPPPSGGHAHAPCCKKRKRDGFLDELFDF